VITAYCRYPCPARGATINLFGFESGAALATVVGVLIEVPLMLSVVRIVNATRGWSNAAVAVHLCFGPRRAQPNFAGCHICHTAVTRGLYHPHVSNPSREDTGEDYDKYQ
jgi:hypothetical protein